MGIESGYLTCKVVGCLKVLHPSNLNGFCPKHYRKNLLGQVIEIDGKFIVNIYDRREQKVNFTQELETSTVRRIVYLYAKGWNLVDIAQKFSMFVDNVHEVVIGYCGNQHKYQAIKKRRRKNQQVAAKSGRIDKNVVVNPKPKLKPKREPKPKRERCKEYKVHKSRFKTIAIAETMVKMRESGLTLAAIAAHFGCCRQNVEQKIKKYRSLT